ncbi:hypothetical protein F3Y22_tig00001728pilonHSYRG00045 [Hibiscus syriacus]|uniref:Uncharacterized protein n=1 Tax=Hibiscus syriacus TaxID=106335 RepID=A0A6A3CTC8_HIBSY|nr:hypothetical protein F3Y22_tig00001728pilonHSYRG00045 [Hibiscus syriacus]
MKLSTINRNPSLFISSSDFLGDSVVETISSLPIIAISDLLNCRRGRQFPDSESIDRVISYSFRLTFSIEVITGFGFVTVSARLIVEDCCCCCCCRLRGEREHFVSTTATAFSTRTICFSTVVSFAPLVTATAFSATTIYLSTVVSSTTADAGIILWRELTYSS